MDGSTLITCRASNEPHPKTDSGGNIMRNLATLVTVLLLLLFVSSTQAANKVVVIPLGSGSSGVSGLDYQDVISLKENALPGSIVPLDGGSFIPSDHQFEYTVPTDKVLVVTMLHIRTAVKTAGTYKYTLILYRETPPRPGPQYELWRFNIQDDGGGENRAYHFSPGILIPEGDLITLENFVANPGGVSIQLIGYLIDK